MHAHMIDPVRSAQTAHHSTRYPTLTMRISLASIAVAAVLSTCAAFSPPHNGVVRVPISCHAVLSDDRRHALVDMAKILGGAMACAPHLAGAASLDAVGNAQTPLPDASLPSSASSTSSAGLFLGEETQFATLPNGVKVKDFKIGTGAETIGSTSQSVSLQMNGRLINTNAGITFYDTKKNNPDGFGAIPLRIDLGRGEALPGLETGLVGMKKNGIRRIVVPAGDLSYDKYPDLEPRPMNDVDSRALYSVVKNKQRDATVMFDVKVERFK